MPRFILGRLGQALLVILIAYTAAFFLLYALPSDPISLLLGTDSGDITEEQRAALAAQYGFDQPLIVQYWHHLWSLLTGDLGFSVQQSRSVAEILLSAIGPTLQLAAFAFLIALVFGLGLGLAAAGTRSSWFSQALLGLPSLGVSIPAFWFGLVLIQLFSFQWQIFPAFNAEGLVGLILPAVTLALPTGAMVAQIFARSLINVQGQPFATTARSKGAGHRYVLLRHVSRNALLPVLTITGLVVGQLFSGTVVTETVFSRPGLGRVIASAVTSQDIPVVLGAVLIGALLYTVTNLIVDLIYPLIDPRLRAAIRTQPSAHRRVRLSARAFVNASAAASATDAQTAPSDGGREPETDFAVKVTHA